MMNSSGQVRDISRLVTGFSITEDLFSPVLVLNLSIRDSVNFMEEFGLTGQETIRVELTRKNHESFGRTGTVKLDFVVLEYQNHSRDENSWHVQNYSLTAISDFAYISGLKKISRAISGNTADLIAQILHDDLNIDASRIVREGEPTSKFSGVLNIQTPLAAVKWLIKKTFDSNGSPYFIHQPISTGKLIIRPYLDLIKNQDSYATYTRDYAAVSNAGTRSGFVEGASKILEMKSNLGFNRLSQAQRGAFASSTNFLDVSTKTYWNRKFNNASSGNGLSFLTDKSTESGSKLSALSDCSINEVHVNTLAFGPDGDGARTGGFDQAVHNAYSAMAQSESYSHALVLNGDFELNPGRLITLQIPRSINPELHPESRSDLTDLSLSGQYLIKNTVHSFQSGTYHSAIKVIRN